MFWLDLYDLSLDWIFKIHHFSDGVWGFLMKELDFAALGLGRMTVFECLFMFGISSILVAKITIFLRNAGGL